MHPFHLIANSHVSLETCVQKIHSPLDGLRIKSHTCFYFLVGKDISQLLHPFHLIANSHVLLALCVQNIASPFDGIKT